MNVQICTYNIDCLNTTYIAWLSCLATKNQLLAILLRFYWKKSLIYFILRVITRKSTEVLKLTIFSM